MLAFLCRLIIGFVLLPVAFWCDVKDGHFDDYLFFQDDTDR